MDKLKKVSYSAWITLGIVFISSSLLKSLDVFAVSLKIQEYAQVFGIMMPIYLYGIGSIVLIAIELILGLFLIKRIYIRFAYFSSTIIIIAFLVITFYLAITNITEDCGCFGSVWAVSPWMSFIKNIILIFVAIIAYPQIKYESNDNRRDRFICIGLTLFLCGFSMVNQPLVDSSEFSIGKKLSINKESPTSIDVDFPSERYTDIHTFGVLRKMNSKCIYDFLQQSEESVAKRVIITSLVPSALSPDIYQRTIIGFMDSSTLNNILTTEFGVITIDNNSVIIDKWQQDYIGLQDYDSFGKNSRFLLRIIYMFFWIAILAYSLFGIIISITRGCRKTFPRVGKTN